MALPVTFFCWKIAGYRGANDILIRRLIVKPACAGLSIFVRLASEDQCTSSISPEHIENWENSLPIALFIFLQKVGGILRHC